MREDGENVNAQTERSPSLLLSLQRNQCESCAVCKVQLHAAAVPKLLPCLHPVCKACVLNNNEDRGNKECPVCGQHFTMSEVADCFLFEDYVPKCGGCETTSVGGWCKQCDEALCSDCVLAHQRVKVTRNHTVIPQDPASGFCTSLCCTSHKRERLRFFCLVCDELTCRDCQLFDHRGHSFIQLEEAVVSQKQQLMTKLHTIRDQRNKLKDNLQDLEERLCAINDIKTESKKKLSYLLSSMYSSLIVRLNQLCEEMEAICNEEEKSLNMVKTNLKMLVDRQEYMAAFIQKVLSTKGQCVLLHKKQVDRRLGYLLSQGTCLPDTVLQLSIQSSQDFSRVLKTCGSCVVTRVPPDRSRKCRKSSQPRDALDLTDRGNVELNCGTSAPHQASTRSMPTTDQSQSRGSESAPLQPVQLTQGTSHTTAQQVLTLNPVQSQVPSVAPQIFTLPTAQCTNAQITVNQVNQGLLRSALAQPSQPKQVFRSLSHPQSSLSVPSQNVLQFSHPQSRISLPGHTVLNVLPSNLLQHSLVTSPLLLVQPQPGVVAAGPQLSLAPNPSFSGHNASSQSTQPKNLTTTQPPSLSSNLPSLAQSIQSSPAMCILQKSSPNVQQSFPQAVSRCQASSKSQTVTVQNSQPGFTQSTVQTGLRKVLVNKGFHNLRTTWNFHSYTPVSAVSQATILTSAPQQATPTSVENKTLQLVPSKVTCPPSAPRHSDVVIFSNKTHDETVYSKPPLTASLTPSASDKGGQGHSICLNQRPSCEPPVKAPADSVCEREIICSRSFPFAVSEEQDSDLPTSTVPETDLKETPAGLSQHSPPISSPDPLSVTSKKDCSPVLSKSPRNTIKTLSSCKSASSADGWPAGRRTKILHHLLTNADSEVGASAEHAMPRSTKSLPSAKQDEEEETDNSDSELVESMDGTTSEGLCVLRKSGNRYLHVSLMRLPISGSPPPQFRIVPNGQEAEILLQEIHEDQSVERWLRIPAPPSLSPLGDPDSPLLVDVLDCAVCLSVGASLQCAECGRSFHSDCHVPAIVFHPTAAWVCTLCHEVSDADPFSRDRLKEPYLNLQDQRKCEQLLLSLMCEENCYLLYTPSKTSGCVEFDFIVKRMLGKCSPPYRSAAEMVSDLWALFDILLASSKKRELVLKLQSSFQKRLHAAFGESLHASLLKPCSAELKGTPGTDKDRENAKTTLKRMREFLKSAVVAKKPHIDNR